MTPQQPLRSTAPWGKILLFNPERKIPLDRKTKPGSGPLVKKKLWVE
jgi:hypothetical protein